MSAQDYLRSLSTDHLKILHGDLVNAGIAFEAKGNYRSIFEARRKESKGKRKKLYAALFKANKAQINEAIQGLIELLPNGINSNDKTRID
ncbi:MAG: hypothetical protein ACXWTR_05375 [Methylotenera sp.]